RSASRTARAPSGARARGHPPLRARPIRGRWGRTPGEPRSTPAAAGVGVGRGSGFPWASTAPQASAARPIATPVRGNIAVAVRSGGGAGVDLYDGVEQGQGIGLLALERVAPDDRAEAAAVAAGAPFLEELLGG